MSRFECILGFGLWSDHWGEKYQFNRLVKLFKRVGIEYFSIE